jgi:hypothetical protein
MAGVGILCEWDQWVVNAYPKNVRDNPTAKMDMQELHKGVKQYCKNQRNCALKSSVMEMQGLDKGVKRYCKNQRDLAPKGSLMGSVLGHLTMMAACRETQTREFASRSNQLAFRTPNFKFGRPTYSAYSRTSNTLKTFFVLSTQTEPGGDECEE